MDDMNEGIQKTKEQVFFSEHGSHEKFFARSSQMHSALIIARFNFFLTMWDVFIFSLWIYKTH